MEREDIFVFADREKLARVFNNILKNAAAYSYPNTEITISVEERNGKVEIMICNHGNTIRSGKVEKTIEKC